ncbi:MAG: alanine racemase [Desulfobacterales bacterium]|nr:alanine racemase [Desulfobacterales bacterium]
MINRNVWAEIDLAAVSHNVGQLKKLLRPECLLMAVVKANAYGHGMIEVSGRALKEGADFLGVARISEAIRLREGYIDAPVLIFGYTDPEYAATLINYDLTQTVYAFEHAKRLSDMARQLGGKIKIHLKVDTGMGRLGILPCELNPPEFQGKFLGSAIREVEMIARLPGIKLEGIYTHFATADHPDKTFALRQFELFDLFIAEIKKCGIEIKIKHAANSAAIIEMPQTHMDMVRAGISVYGIYPSDSTDRTKISLKPVMALKSRVIHVKRVNAGFSVSYGAAARTGRPTAIATVAIGYADGFNRQLSSAGRMLVNGASAPVIGRVCMDQTMIDVGDAREALVGDEVVVIGTQGVQSIGVDEIAHKIHTISYEVLTGVSDRVQRIYSA